MQRFFARLLDLRHCKLPDQPAMSCQRWAMSNPDLHRLGRDKEDSPLHTPLPHPA